MRLSRRRPQFTGVALSIFGISAVAAWAISLATENRTATVALAGVTGVVTFAVALTAPFARARNRTSATGLALVGAAVVVGAMGQTAADRTTVFAISGAILFCAAELADRSLARARGVERRRGVERWSLAWVLGGAIGSAGLSYAAIATRGLLGGGGPAALAVGTAGAMLLSFLAALVLRTRARSGV